MTTDENPSSKVRFFNLRVNVLDTQSFFDAFQQHLTARKTVSITFLNAHCFNIAQKNSAYRDALENSTFLLNDGVGVDIAGKLVGVHFKENLNGTDLIPRLLEYFATHKLKVFCYGASKEVIEKAVRQIEADYASLSIVGYSDGFVDSQAALIDQINSSQADAVILGMGVPKQELWAANYGEQLKFARILVSGGAIFDFLSGNVLRAPEFIRRIKLEWLFRLAQEPVRLFSRYVLGSFVFFYYVIIKRPGPHNK